MRNFEAVLEEIDGSIKCIQGSGGKFQNWPLGDCFIGVPSDLLYGRAPLLSIPENSIGFHFYLGSNAIELIQSFTESKYAKTVERLSIGNSCYDSGKGKDYSEITKILTTSHFPRLRSLELGVWQLFSNSHCLFGRLGNVSSLMKKFVHLENLYLYGHFSMSETIKMPSLKNLQIQVEDPVTGSSGEAIDCSTVTNLFESHFPVANELFIDLADDESEYIYEIPFRFISGESSPNVQKLEITGSFTAESLKNLAIGELARWLGKSLVVSG